MCAVARQPTSSWELPDCWHAEVLPARWHEGMVALVPPLRSVVCPAPPLIVMCPTNQIIRMPLHQALALCCNNAPLSVDFVVVHLLGRCPLFVACMLLLCIGATGGRREYQPWLTCSNLLLLPLLLQVLVLATEHSADSYTSVIKRMGTGASTAQLSQIDVLSPVVSPISVEEIGSTGFLKSLYRQISERLVALSASATRVALLVDSLTSLRVLADSSAEWSAFLHYLRSFGAHSKVQYLELSVHWFVQSILGGYLPGPIFAAKVLICDAAYDLQLDADACSCLGPPTLLK